MLDFYTGYKYFLFQFSFRNIFPCTTYPDYLVKNSFFFFFSKFITISQITNHCPWIKGSTCLRPFLFPHKIINKVYCLKFLIFFYYGIKTFGVPFFRVTPELTPAQYCICVFSNSTSALYKNINKQTTFFCHQLLLVKFLQNP